MKKTATGLTLAAALSLTAFSAAPASAEVPLFDTCAEAKAEGYGNFVPGDANYENKRDTNNNDVVCEGEGLSRTDGAAAPAPAPAASQDPRDQALPDAAYTYPDCEDAYAAGVFNILSSSDDYHDDLDSDQDGVGCEYNVEYGVIVEGREQAAAEEIAAIKASAVQESASDDEDEQQVTVVPEGTPATGAEGTPLAPFAAGALALAAVAGTGVAMRRRRA